MAAQPASIGPWLAGLRNLFSAAAPWELRRLCSGHLGAVAWLGSALGAQLLLAGFLTF